MGVPSPSKYTLELLTQAQQDVRENGRGTYCGGLTLNAPYFPIGINDLDKPLLSLDRRFTMKRPITQDPDTHKAAGVSKSESRAAMQQQEQGK